MDELPPIKRLCDVCSSAAANGLKPDIAKRIMTLMDNMKPEDLGIHARRKARSPPGVIRTLSVLENEKLEVVVFVFPERAVIPLHDHPGMSVFSKVLYGSISMRSFDWVEPVSSADLEGEILTPYQLCRSLSSA